MRIFLNIFLSLLLANFLFAQTAVDFTTDDCNGLTHNLFDSLDAGNVIVIAWVMPCGGCISYAQDAYNAVQQSNLSYPGLVDFYLVDDYANTSCVNLVNWGNSNNMPLHTAFSSSDIKMSDYGANGMPKVVVLGGSNHQVFYNTNDNQIDFNDISLAIDDALGATLAINNKETSNFGLSVFPNPVNDFLSINYKVSDSNPIIFEVVNLLGETVLTLNDNQVQLVGTNERVIDLNILKNGVYFLKANSKSVQHTLRFIVSR